MIQQQKFPSQLIKFFSFFNLKAFKILGRDSFFPKKITQLYCIRSNKLD